MIMRIVYSYVTKASPQSLLVKMLALDPSSPLRLSTCSYYSPISKSFVILGIPYQKHGGVILTEEGYAIHGSSLVLLLYASRLESRALGNVSCAALALAVTNGHRGNGRDAAWCRHRRPLLHEACIGAIASWLSEDPSGPGSNASQTVRWGNIMDAAMAIVSGDAQAT